MELVTPGFPRPAQVMAAGAEIGRMGRAVLLVMADRLAAVGKVFRSVLELTRNLRIRARLSKAFSVPLPYR
ncbi:hypothetical protein REMIM1_PE00202 (plasmid) [Rhizobium etli bv. mimosae str. Mim1]|nr:hypothetical protein REMIM1_PE00202 [Rhizobium etli bv. mimosae str. Mim1]